MAITTDTVTAPVYWASYLVNGDASGINDEERQAADRYFQGWSVLSTAGEEPHFTWHYALYGGINAEGGDVIDYIVTPA